MKSKLEKPVLMIDGVCNFCHWIVKFAFRRDPNGNLLYVNVQSESGKALIKKFGLPHDFNSSALIEDTRIYFKSTCALRIMKYLRFPWPMVYSFIILPKWFRDFFYDIIDKKRYEWFGKMEECPVPGPELKARFI